MTAPEVCKDCGKTHSITSFKIRMLRKYFEDQKRLFNEISEDCTEYVDTLKLIEKLERAITLLDETLEIIESPYLAAELKIRIASEKFNQLQELESKMDVFI